MPAGHGLRSRTRENPPDDGSRTPGVGEDKPPIDSPEWAKELFEDDYDAIEERFGDSAAFKDILADLKDEADVAVDSKTSVGGEPHKMNQCDADDDDCVILDGDPEKAVVVAKEEGPCRDTAEDDLKIVAEKGEVACRDFPHPRHLCASLAFGTTSHASHCSMCHCYVCDSLAPCAYWGKGTGSNDHCHATDKDPKWKKLRQSLKSKRQRKPKLGGVKKLLQSSSESANVRIPSTGRFPVSSTASQTQQVHTSITVSQNMVQGILPRATSMPRTTIQSNRSKRARVAPPAYTP